jgi:hypothetical protein
MPEPIIFTAVNPKVHYRVHKTLPLDSVMVKGKAYPCNRPWRPIGLWDVEAPTFSRQSAHRWRRGYQLFHCTDPKLLIRKIYYVLFLIPVFIVQVTKLVCFA